MENFILIIAGIFAGNVLMAQPVVNSTNEVVNARSGIATNPDSMVWFIGAVLVVFFIFILVIALAKGATAMSESIDVSINNKT